MNMEKEKAMGLSPEVFSNSSGDQLNEVAVPVQTEIKIHPGLEKVKINVPWVISTMVMIIQTVLSQS